ncbi:MAG: hypothetical protein IJ598_10620 [Ruminococcus sp.]|nr:hypothetical protein [Ruminococcus sp.]
MKHKILTSALAVMLIGASAFSAFALTGCSCSGKQPAATASQQAAATTAPAVTEPQAGKVYETKDVLSCNAWIGQMASQIGMKDYVNTLDGTKKVEIKGTLFDVPVTGYATIVQNGDVISALDFTTDGLTYDNAKAQLTQKYGNPLTDEAESCSFRAGSNTATLTSGEKGVTLSIR